MGAAITRLYAAAASLTSPSEVMECQTSFLPLIDEIRELAASDSSREPCTHTQILTNIHALQLAAETPLETIYRIGHQSWQNAAIKTALDLDIFDILVERAPGSVELEELALKHSADTVLVVRIMRVITALGLCTEVDVGRYSANSKTIIMTVPQGTTSFRFWFDMAMPTAAQLPSYLRTTSYSNPRDNETTAFAHAFGLEFWAWLAQHPEHAAVFNGFMASRRQGRPSWFDIYPVTDELSGESEDDVLLVDIGGNQGHDLINLKAKHPNLRGRLVLQDLSDVVAKANFEDVSISAMGHNFFDEQPIKAAHVYHFRAIFHDWPDEQCLQILKHTVHAMKPGFSKLLISEFVLPDAKTGLFPASLDLQMMGLHAGMERSEGQWRMLLGAVGLKVVRIWRGTGGTGGGECVIEAGL